MIEVIMASYGCDESGEFNTASKVYKANPSIENYVKLRRNDPGAEIEVGVIGGMDQLFFMANELERYGFDPELVESTMNADPQAISELSLQIMEKMIEARNLAKSGKTHLIRRGSAIPDKLIHWLISCMLDSLSWNDDLHIPRDLIVLIRERLGGSNPEYEQAADTHERRYAAIQIGGQLKARGITPSFRAIARILSVSPSTVMRWFPNGEFEQEIEVFSRLFDENGNLRPLELKAR